MVRSRVLKISYMHSWTLLSWFNAWIRKLLFLPPTHFARIEYRYHPTDSAIESILPYHTHTRIAPVHPEHSFGQQRHAIGKGTSLRPFTSVAHTHTFIFRQGGISPTPRLEEFPSRISEVLASFLFEGFISRQSSTLGLFRLNTVENLMALEADFFQGLTDYYLIWSLICPVVSPTVLRPPHFVYNSTGKKLIAWCSRWEGRQCFVLDKFVHFWRL